MNQMSDKCRPSWNELREAKISTQTSYHACLQKTIFDHFRKHCVAESMGPNEVATSVWESHRDLDFQEILALVWGMAAEGVFEMDSRLKVSLPSLKNSGES